VGVLIRAGAAAAVALCAAACTPEIGRGTYFCGPERFCPPSLECDDSTFTCESPSLVQPFACPTDPIDSRRFEPDDTPAQAHDLGRLACGVGAIESSPGCLVDINDVDHMRFEHSAQCTGSNPHIEIVLRYPVALVPVVVELLDEDEQVVATGEICTLQNDLSGMERLCIRDDLPFGIYYVRIRSDRDGPDCGGSCHFNQYILDVRYRLS
jgi:hypothetical protein